MAEDENGLSLAKRLAAHRQWLDSGGAQGIRADFTGMLLKDADFSGAMLDQAWLSGADLEGEYVEIDDAHLEPLVLRTQPEEHDQDGHEDHDCSIDLHLSSPIANDPGSAPGGPSGTAARAAEK